MTTFGGGYHLNGAFFVNGNKGVASGTVSGLVVVTYIGTSVSAIYAGNAITLSVGQYLPAGTVVTCAGGTGSIFLGAAFTN